MKIENGCVHISQFKELNLLQQIDTRRDEIIIEKSRMSERQSINHNDFTMVVIIEITGIRASMLRNLRIGHMKAFPEETEETVVMILRK